MDKLKIEPKFKELIPPLSPDEFTGLEELILKEGIRDAITTWNGIIVDGHNRFEIAEKHGITDYPIMEKNFHDESETMVWIINNQLGRRNLTNLARIELVKKRKPLIRDKAKEHQIRKPINSVPLVLAEQNYRENETREQLAKLAGVSQETFRRGEKILENGSPKLINEVREGKKKINTAYREMQTGTVICKVCGVEKPAAESSVDRKALCLECENVQRREQQKARKEKAKHNALEQSEPITESNAKLANELSPTGEEPPKNEELPTDEEPLTGENLPTNDEPQVDEVDEEIINIYPNYTIDAFEIEFEENAQNYIELAERFITGHYSPLWKKRDYKLIALSALDKVIEGIKNLKGMV